MLFSEGLFLSGQTKRCDDLTQLLTSEHPSAPVIYRFHSFCVIHG